MPRVTPVTAEAMNSTVVTTMMPTCDAGLTGSPETAFRPLLICSAPMPSEAATPKAVAMTASTLTSRASALSGLQGSELTAVLTSAELAAAELEEGDRQRHDAVDRPGMQAPMEEAVAHGGVGRLRACCGAMPGGGVP